MKSKKDKYLIWTPNGLFTSNSRNARKHLIEQGVRKIYVHTNTETPRFLCMAVYKQNCILVGTEYKA